jgi:acyl-CoA reductase-like NAD-dependent aldehyde dehydrogenase
MASKFRNAGQTCVCADRFLVHATVHDEFVAKLVAKVKALSVGHGLVDGIKIGPLINEAGVSKVKSQVEDAVSKGAQIVCGGSDGEGAGSGSSSGSGGGHFYSPTVLTGCTSAMQCFSEETFGPLVPVFAFQSEEEAIALANQADVGLAGYFCSKDLG